MAIRDKIRGRQVTMPVVSPDTCPFDRIQSMEVVFTNLGDSTRRESFLKRIRRLGFIAEALQWSRPGNSYHEKTGRLHPTYLRAVANGSTREYVPIAYSVFCPNHDDALTALEALCERFGHWHLPIAVAVRIDRQGQGSVKPVATPGRKSKRRSGPDETQPNAIERLARDSVATVHRQMMNAGHTK